MPIFASTVAFVTYSSTGNVIDPAPVFSSLAMFNVLRLPLNLLPIVIAQTIDAWVSLKRIEEYLVAEEITDALQHDIPPDSDDAVIIEDGEFTWERVTADGEGEGRNKKPKKEKKSKRSKALDEKAETEPSPENEEEKEPFRISGINLNLKRGELTAIVGGVGSGKTSLLAAIAGDMRKVNGKVRIHEGDQIGYCPQYAWIQNASVRENIVFGKEYDPEWYQTVVQACALTKDFEILPYGDMTEIGERGITISGGQKARTNIARAIYFDAEIILMDDPLSAVDAHVGRHLFENAITGLLKDKCVVLATHQLHVLGKVDKVIWMDGGKIKAVGTYEELMANNEAFVEMMKSTTVEEVVEAEEEAIEEKEKKELELVRAQSSAAISSKAAKPAQKALMQEEERAVKAIGWDVYKAYIKASGSYWVGVLVIVLLFLAQAANIMTTLWLGYWTSGKYNLKEGHYMAGYASLGVLQSILMFFFALSLTIGGTRASKKLMNKAMEKVLRAPMAFFDTTPMGRIINRFSKDVDVLDNNITDAIRMYFMTLASKFLDYIRGVVEKGG